MFSDSFYKPSFSIDKLVTVRLVLSYYITYFVVSHWIHINFLLFNFLLIIIIIANELRTA